MSQEMFHEKLNQRGYVEGGKVSSELSVNQKKSDQQDVGWSDLLLKARREQVHT